MTTLAEVARAVGGEEPVVASLVQVDEPRRALERPGAALGVEAIPHAVVLRVVRRAVGFQGAGDLRDVLVGVLAA